MVSVNASEISSKAIELYEQKWKLQLEQTHLHDFIAIEPESETFYFGHSLSNAISAARSVFPDRLAFAMRVGHNSAVDIELISI